jgi:hypothetical protein
MILGLKLGRRLLAAVAFNDEETILCDSRFVPSRKEDLDRVFAKYFDQLIAQVKPVEVFYYAPTGPQTLTERLVHVLSAAVNRVGLPASRVTKQDLMFSFGLPPLRMRRELRECVSPFVPQVSENKTARQVVIAEAAATALVGELTRGLRGS